MPVGGGSAWRARSDGGTNPYRKQKGATVTFEPSKSTWVTRRIPAELHLDWEATVPPRIGDVLACEVITTGFHRRVETALGGRSQLYPGDRIMCVVGNRYATSSLEGRGLVGGEMIDMLSASGVCGTVVGRADKAGRPTRLRVLGRGMLGESALNVRSFALAPVPRTGTPEPTWLVVVGSAMDAGKTTAATSIIRGLRRHGLRVGAAKLTGTTSARDVSSFADAGAAPVVDLLDAGWPSTDGCSLPELDALVASLTGQLRVAGVDVGVLEIADGLLQRETGLLLEHLADWIGPFRVVLAAKEALAAVAGAHRLVEQGHDVLAVTGIVTSFPLACREVEAAGGIECIRTEELGDRLSVDLDRVPLNGLGGLVAAR